MRDKRIKNGNKEEYCPIQATIDILEKKWTLNIIRTLLGRKKRFNELGLEIGGCNSRTLAIRLKALEEDMLITRRVLTNIPPWVEYELTDRGRSLLTILDSISDWGRKWMSRDDTR
jgi:DNA-binding HxlR family transcriptional regulator